MTDYTMPVLSEQEREKAIVACIDEIGHLKQMVAAAKSGGRYSATGYQSQLIRQKIALAALTSKPTDFLAIGDDDAEYNGIRNFSFRPNTVIELYRAPPVPVKQEGEQ